VPTVRVTPGVEHSGSNISIRKILDESANALAWKASGFINHRKSLPLF
jgi:hypothetical protein